MTADALSPQWLKYSVSHVFSFSHCPSELPSIVVLPCPILSSSHCVCVKNFVSLLGQGARMPGWKAPGENAFWTPLVRLVWCSASLSCWVSLSGTPGGPLLQTLTTTIFEPPTLLKIPSSSECYYSVILGRETRAVSFPKCLLFVIRDNWHALLYSAISEQTRSGGLVFEIILNWAGLEQSVDILFKEMESQKKNVLLKFVGFILTGI